MLKAAKALLLLPLLATFGCANLDTGLRLAQRGMAVADVGLDRWIDTYSESVLALRFHCSQQADSQACQVQLGVSPEQVAATLQAATLFRQGYDETAGGLSKMEQAWQRLQPQLQATIDAAEGLSR